MLEYRIIVECYPEDEIGKVRVTVDRPGGSGLDYGFMDTTQEVYATIKDAATEIVWLLKNEGVPVRLED